MLIGRGEDTARGRSYRNFLLGTLVYYVFDGAWGIFAGLGWTRGLYVETIFFFLSLVAFVFMWGRFVIPYLELGKRSARILSWFGYAILAFNLVAIAAAAYLASLDLERLVLMHCTGENAVDYLRSRLACEVATLPVGRSVTL